MQTRTYHQYKTDRLKQLRSDYPDADRDEITATMASCEEDWLRSCRDYTRGDVCPPAVYRSLCRLVGPAGALRTFRYAANADALSMQYPLACAIP